MMADIATNDLIKSEGVLEKIISQIYSLPISATPDKEAALEMSMIQFIANAIDGW